ncbi:MAG: hypothetical protein JWQ11_4489 [Rhizobacter sp.]|nr:hypothetical protein [Rhizobacter sp.]
MNTQSILSNPAVLTMSPEQVFQLLKRTAAAAQFKKCVTVREGRPMLSCFADLADFDAELDATSAQGAAE